MHRPSAAGGWPAIWYTIRKARAAGGVWRMLRALRSRNACKTCALGMGGQKGGMVNELGLFPEVCKKSVQAMAADMQGRIAPRFVETFSLDQLRALTPRELEAAGRLVEPVMMETGVPRLCEPCERSAEDDGIAKTPPGRTGESSVRGSGSDHLGAVGTAAAHARSDYYRPIAWDEALDTIARALAAAPPDETFFYFSGRSSNEAAYLLHLFARLYGTNNINNCSYYCHQASGVGLASVTGSGTATITLEDLDRLGDGDVLFLIGGNPASNHPRFMRTLVEIKRRGGSVVVINPLKELGLLRFKVPSDPRSLLFGSSIADEYLQPHIGGDIALLTGLAKAVLELGAADARFIDAHTEGFASFERLVRGTAWGVIERESGVNRADLERVARLYARAGNAVFCWTMGITHHAHGVDNVRMIANLALLRGMVGRPGAGLLPLRGHSNVQGVGSVGAVPALKQHMLEKIERYFAVTLPRGPGLDTLEGIERAAGGKLRVVFCLGGNLFGSNPDAAYAARALANVDLVVYLSTTLNTGHAWGVGQRTMVLPVLARDEEPQPTTQESMFNFVRLSDGGPRRLDGPRSEVEIIAELARRTFAALAERASGDGGRRDLGDVDFDHLRDHGAIRQAISATVPGYAPIGAIDSSKREFHVQGRVFHEPVFATDSRKARFHPVAIPAFGVTNRATDDRQPTPENRHSPALRLMTIRSEGQFNTVVYEEEDLYRGQERRDVILMAREDIERLGLRENQPVDVRSDTGVMRGVLARAIDIRPGNAAMYYPEANVLVPRAVDGESRTPTFKHVRVTVIPADSSNRDRGGAASAAASPVMLTASAASTRRSMRAC
ncbi:MAG: FdhF/YdeP family oxidoreductase [Phycisphaerales bacterium]|nr:FdhF/YdeP family oxidoreductase [Phycisphaerales bacterium]